MFVKFLKGINLIGLLRISKNIKEYGIVLLIYEWLEFVFVLSLFHSMRLLKYFILKPKLHKEEAVLHSH